jgi:RND family efflux transporter MFP subunit
MKLERTDEFKRDSAAPEANSLEMTPSVAGLFATATFRAFVAFLAGGLALSGCARHEPPRRAPATVSVRTEMVVARTESATAEAVGTLRAVREATISGKVMGTVIEIRKRAGDAVREGEILLVIDSREVSGQVMQAQGALAQARAAGALAETNFHRFEQLFARGAASQLELDQARYQYDTAKGAVQQAEGAVSTASSYQAYAEIPAPFSGRVVDRFCEEGDMASPGRPLMKIEDPRKLRLYASLDGTRAAAAQVGAPVEVQVPAIGDRILRGIVAEVVPGADPITRSILVKIDLEESPDLRAGLFGRARLPLGQRTVLRVPRGAVGQRGGVPGVFVAEGGKAILRMVSLDEDRPENPQVLSGLRSGDRVILDPPADLEVGAPIEARP